MSQQPIPAPFSRLASSTDTGLMTSAHYTKLDALMSQAALTAALATIPTTTAALPDSTDKRYVTDAQRTVLGNTSGANTGDVTVSSPAGWLTRAGQALTFALVAAGAAVDGVVNQVAQSFKGTKTFIDAVVMSAGLTITGTIVGDGGMTSSLGSSVFQITEGLMKGTRGTAKWSLNEGGGGTAQLYNTGAGVEVTTTTTLIYGRGTGATDIAVKIGPVTADASVDPGAKLASIGTGVDTGSFVDYVSVKKGIITLHGDRAWLFVTDPNGASNHWEWRFRSGFDMTWGNNSSVYFGCDINDGYMYSAFGFKATAGATAWFKVGAGIGRLDQKGSDRRASVTGSDAPGSFPIGLNRFAAGQTTCAITTALAGLASHVEITWLSDPGARHWVTLGSGVFTVNLASAPAGNVDFSWRVSGLL